MNTLANFRSSVSQLFLGNIPLNNELKEWAQQQQQSANNHLIQLCEDHRLEVEERRGDLPQLQEKAEKIQNLIDNFGMGAHDAHEAIYAAWASQQFPEYCKSIYIRLNFKQLISLPPGISQITEITKLEFDVNRFGGFPAPLLELRKLKLLSLRCNQITSIPPEIQRLADLEELDLTDNKIEEIPRELCELQSLQVLSLGCNNITSLPRQLQDMPSLVDFSLSKEVWERVLSTGQVQLLVQQGVLQSFTFSLGSLPPEEWGLALTNSNDIKRVLSQRN